MDKKTYQKPRIKVIKLAPRQLLAGSMNFIDGGDTGIGYGGGGSGPARASQIDDFWDD